MSTEVRRSGENTTGTLFAGVMTELLRAGQSARFQAPGTSMQPTIRDGEVITVVPVEYSAIQRGDILLYRSERGLLAHRVVRIRSPHPPTESSAPSPRAQYVLRGDASVVCDRPVAPEQVLGRVVSVERAGARRDLASPGAKLAYATHRGRSVLRRWLP